MELSILDKYNPAKFRTFEPGNICFRRDAVASTLKAMYTNPMSKRYVHLQSHYRDELRPILNSLKEVSFHQGRQLIEVLNAFNSLAFGLTPLLEKYPIGVFFCDDDSVSVEWRMPNLILNLDIESDPEETSWTLSTTDRKSVV